MNNIPKDLRKKLDSSAAEIDPRFKRNLKASLFKENTMSTRHSLLNFLKYMRQAPALAALATIVLVGTSSAIVATNQTNKARNVEIEVPANLDGVLTVDEIRAIVARDHPGATLKSVELENEDGVLLYEVKFTDDSVRFYDAKTGTATVKMEDDEDDDDDIIPSSFQAGITLANARTIALEQRPGKTVTKIELETEDGVVVYSVRFSDGGRVDVSASNGAVMRVEHASNSGSGSSDDSHDDSDSSNSGSGSDNSGSGSDDSGGDSSGSGSSGSGRDPRDDN